MITCNIPHDRLVFSGGEIHVRLQTPVPFVPWWNVRADLHSSDDIMELLLLTDALRRYHDHPIHLVMPYVPYARQDRVCNEGESLSVAVLAKLINAQNYASVTVWDAHSDVTGALIDRVNVRHQSDFVAKVPGIQEMTLISPDAGAVKKVYTVAKSHSNQVVLADKIRNTLTGDIVDTVVRWPSPISGDVLIVDDIIDGGRTFTELAKKLRPSVEGRILLYATHGIFSKGLFPFKGLIDHIYVANLWPDVDTAGMVTVLE